MAVIPPTAVDGPYLVIRKTDSGQFSMDDLIGFGSVTYEQYALLKSALQTRQNILIAGGTGSGKTTFANVLTDEFPNDERVVVNDHPHAPWWQDEIGSLARNFDDYLVIPRAGILESLYHYAERVPVDWLEYVTELTVKSIENLETERFGQGGDTLVNALRLADSPGLAVRFKARLKPFLMEVADAVVARDPEDWSGYSAPPLKLAPTPHSFLVDLLADDLQVYLDYLIDQQTPFGTWEPTWNWGEFYPNDWVVAKEGWRAILTLDTLIALRAFSRLPG